MKRPQTDKIVAALAELYPDAVCSLEYSDDPWRLLVAARLSAQCTDERVNIVCRPLFERFPDAAAAAECDIAELEEIVKPCGLYRMKAQNIRDASRDILTKFGGAVPDTMEGLLSLPGVGRKIANLILGDVYGKGGIVADTHCIRICGRLGYYGTDKKDPVLCERVMEKEIKREEQSAFCHRIVTFGREYCTARAPRCFACPLRDYCAYGEKRKRIKKGALQKVTVRICGFH